MGRISELRLPALLTYALSFSSIVRGQVTTPANGDIDATCKQIAATISNASEVFFPPSPGYTADNAHAFASSSAASTCSVEPGSAQDIGAILRIINSTRTPFAVKSGGHASNPRFSSTSGVQISMARFRNITVNSTAAGVVVIGGRIPGVGVGGLLLGAGYSYKSSQFGLGIDNIVGIEVVLAQWDVHTVTSEDEDLWFALRGGMNNFGIVTKFTLNPTHRAKFGPDKLDAFNQAFSKVAQNNDTKAALVGEFAYASGAVSPIALVFYDAPTPPAGLFDNLLSIPTVSSDVSTRSFADLS
ncbi:hypothetical protein BC834DRAFT_973734 [Gloeopeniophorella convolvens]|nr:hypothetical protein BC834DRAFT_973734 [Gloeopeniophorella convolvens]